MVRDATVKAMTTAVAECQCIELEIRTGLGGLASLAMPDAFAL
jgi:hypothetical protein